MTDEITGSTLKDNIRKLYKAGVSEDKIRDYYNKYKTSSGITEQPKTTPITPPTQPQIPDPTQPKLEQGGPNIEGRQQANQAMMEAERAAKIRTGIANYVRPLAEGLASTGAAAGGAAVSSNPLLAAILFGALGYSAAKTGIDIADDQLASIERGEPESSPNIVPRNISEAQEGFVNGLLNIKEGLEFELLGQNVGGAAGRFANLFKRKVKTPTQEIAEELNQQLTKSEISERKATQLIENILSKAPFSANIMADFRFQKQLKPLLDQRKKLLNSPNYDENQARELGTKIKTQVIDYLQRFENIQGRELERIQNEILADMGGIHKPETIGIAAKDAVKTAEITMRKRATNKFLAVGEHFEPDVHIPTPNLKAAAERHLAEKLKLPAQDGQLLRRLRWAVSNPDSTIDDALNIVDRNYPGLPEDLKKQLAEKLNAEAPTDPSKLKDWITLVTFERELGDIIKQSDALKASGQGIAQLDNVGRIYIDLKKALQQDMEEAALARGGDAWTKYQIAKNFYRTEIGEVFRTKTIQNMYKTNPEKVTEMLFSPNAITEYRILKKALKESPQDLEQIKESFTQNLLGLNKIDKTFDPKSFKKSMERYGEEYLKEIYGVRDYASLKLAADKGTYTLLMQPVGKTYLNSLINSGQFDPVFIVDDLIKAAQKPTSGKQFASHVKFLKTVLDEDTFTELGDTFLQKAFEVDKKTGYLDPVRLSKSLIENQRILKIWFPGRKYNDLMKIADIGIKQQEASRLVRDISERETLAAWTTGQLLLRAVTSPSVRSIASASTIALAPNLLARLYLSENGLRLLKEASTIPLTSAKAAEITTKMLNIMYGTPTRPGSIPKLERERRKRKYEEEKKKNN